LDFTFSLPHPAGVAGDKPTERLRLFVAVPIPGAVGDEISRAQGELRELAPRQAVRWTPPEQFHLTLKFLGDVAVERVDALIESVGAVCRTARPLRLRAQGIGFFPDDRHPRVIWAGITGETGGLAGLQKEIETAARPSAERTGEENVGSFFGHVTLGRIKEIRRGILEKLLQRAGAIGGGVFGEWMAREVEIVQSELSGNGARHTALARFALGRCDD
jgi:RNA 2',3'-cyclic 3'-phosphodiesterase